MKVADLISTEEKGTAPKKPMEPKAGLARVVENFVPSPVYPQQTNYADSIRHTMSLDPERRFDEKGVATTQTVGYDRYMNKLVKPATDQWIAEGGEENEPYYKDVVSGMQYMNKHYNSKFKYLSENAEAINKAGITESKPIIIKDLKYNKLQNSFLPQRLVKDIVSVAQQNGVDPSVLVAMAMQESGGQAFSPQKLLNAHYANSSNPDEAPYMKYSIDRFLADRHGLKGNKGTGDPILNREKYLSGNYNHMQDYRDYLDWTTKQNPNGANHAGEVSWQDVVDLYKKIGVKGWNPGQKKAMEAKGLKGRSYEEDIQKNLEILQGNPELLQYINQVKSGKIK